MEHHLQQNEGFFFLRKKKFKCSELLWIITLLTSKFKDQFSLQHKNEICKRPKGDLPTVKVNVERLIIFSSNQQRLGFGSHPGPLKTDLEKGEHLWKRGVCGESNNLIYLLSKLSLISKPVFYPYVGIIVPYIW